MLKQFLLNPCHVLIDGLFESVPILLSFMVISFGASEKETGMILSLAIMVSTFLGLSTAFFSRHVGLLPTFSLIILLSGLGFFTNAFSQNIYLTGFCFIIALAGYSIFHNLAFTYLTANSTRCSLGKTMGNFTAIGDIGRIPFASLAAFIATCSTFGFPGWRIVCLTYGIGALLIAGSIFVYLLQSPKQNEQEISPLPAPKKLLPSFALLRNRQYALAISANVLDALGSDQIFVFLPYLLLAKGMEPTVFASFALAFTMGCFLGKVVCGRMIDHFGTRKIFVVSELLMAILLIALMIEHHAILIIGASLLLGIVTKGTIPVIQTIITEPITEKEQFDDIFAISSFARGITNMITPLLFGVIASLFGIHFIYGIMTFAAICAIIPILTMNTYHPQKI